jgi:hypothetical protein
VLRRTEGTAAGAGVEIIGEPAVWANWLARSPF